MFPRFETCEQEVRDRVLRHSNGFGRVVVLVVAVLLLVFLVDLFRTDAGQVAGALGSFIGGIIGAGGAVMAVFLMLARQRQEETAKVADAVRTEITTLAKYVIGAVDVCQQINTGLKVARQDARYIAKNFWGDPIVYPAVADRIGLLPYPQATTEFYMRLSEVRGMLESLRTKTDLASATYVTAPPEYVTPKFAETVADSLITALQLARPIVANDGYPSTKSQLAVLVQATVAGQIDECLKSAKASFPNAESFQAPL